MNQRFFILTFTACTVMFAGIWAATAPTPHPAAAPATVGDAVAAVTYADCDAVRAANAAPLRAGQPGYRPGLDANMNGIACETTSGATAAPVAAVAPAAEQAAPIESQPLPDLPAPPQIDLPPPDPRMANPPQLQ